MDLHGPTHHIQRSILSSLLGTPNASFSQLKPKGIESNLFLYHLQRLQADKLVEKGAEGYSLTETGRILANQLDDDARNARTVMPLCIMMIRDSSGRFVFAKRQRHPYLGKYGFPSSSLIFGQTLDNIKKVILNELELVPIAAKLHPQATVLMQHYKNDRLATHLLAIIFTAELGATLRPSEKYQLATLDELPSEDCIAGTYELGKLYQSNKLTGFSELRFDTEEL